MQDIIEAMNRVAAELEDRAKELRHFAMSLERATDKDSLTVGEWYYIAQNTTNALHEAIRPVSIVHEVQLVNRTAFEFAAAHEAVQA